MRARRDPELNTGCQNCANYIGEKPINIHNFKCKKGVKSMKVFICLSFDFKRKT